MKTLEQNIARVLPELADAMSKPSPSREELRRELLSIGGTRERLHQLRQDLKRAMDAIDAMLEGK